MMMNDDDEEIYKYKMQKYKIQNIKYKIIERK